MPFSHHEGKEWSRERIIEADPSTVIDIGVGSGTYSELVRGDIAAYWIGVEIWEPYVEQYDLAAKYDELVIHDARDCAFPSEPFTLLAGDVVEHMQHGEGEYFLKRAMRSAAEHILVSVPIIHYPQGQHGGNVYESHLCDWTFEEMRDLLSDCETYRGEVLGCFWWSR